MADNDRWRVDVAGSSVTVLGEQAKDHLCQVNRRMARMTLALHKIAKGAPEQFQQIARDALGQGERA